jgi:hypothetical protein
MLVLSLYLLDMFVVLATLLQSVIFSWPSTHVNNNLGLILGSFRSSNASLLILRAFWSSKLGLILKGHWRSDDSFDSGRSSRSTALACHHTTTGYGDCMRPAVFSGPELQECLLLEALLVLLAIGLDDVHQAEGILVERAAVCEDRRAHPRELYVPVGAGRFEFGQALLGDF